MNYIGSKHKLSAFIKENIIKVAGELKDKVFTDIFAGTGIMGRVVKKSVKQVIANDIEPYSYVLLKNYIGNHKPIDYFEMLNVLDNLPPLEGFIYKNYCAGSGSGRQYFTDDNGKKIDAIRVKIKEWKDNNVIDNNQYYFFLASLLESADKIANTASVYGAFLKHVKRSASKPLILEPAIFEQNSDDHQVYNEDANILIKKIQGDILYLDPPYNHRQYGANYHMLNTIALYDDFTPHGKTGLRNYIVSDYCRKGRVNKVFEDLISNAKFKYIFLSYNNEGLMSLEEVKHIMSKYGEYGLITKKYQRFKADKDVNRVYKADSTFEYLHVLVKGNEKTGILSHSLNKDSKTRQLSLF